MPGGLLNRSLVGMLQQVPKPLVWRFSKRYIAGTELADAYSVVRALNDEGCSATIDVLGEDSTALQQVEAARDLYLEAIRGISDRSLDCNVSVKLSELGLRFDSALCARVMGELVGAAAAVSNFVRIDMEDSSVTTATLELFRELRGAHRNVGAVIQSCLHRSASDVEELLQAGIANVRLCKGIYIEPEEISYRDPEDIRSAYRELLERLLKGKAERVGIATHDPLLVEHAERTLRKLRVPKSRYEFQMLLGVAGNLRRELVSRGHPLRVYVPFGENWHAYSMRRLRENPNMMGHLIGNLLNPQ